MQWERLADGGQDLDSDGFATEQTTTVAAPGTCGVLEYSTITFTSSQIDSVVAGDLCRIKVRRDTSDAADTMSGDAELFGVLINEVA